MKSPFKSFGDYEYAMKKLGHCVGDVLTYPSIRSAIAFISPTLTIKATAQRKQVGRDKSATCLVTVGRPNFVERRFIGVCKKTGIAFPVAQVLWKSWPKKKPEKRVRLPRMKVSAMRPISARATTTAV